MFHREWSLLRLPWLVLISLIVLFAVGSAVAQDAYIGDQICAYCHADKYENYIQSGHPWKLFNTAGQVPAEDTYPHTPLPPLAASLANGWDDVEYIIGNFFWKARFVTRDGYIHTGNAVQWNLETQQFSAYNAGKVTKFDCGKCHTTGYSPEGQQGDLPGMVGTWVFEGIRCEACHSGVGPHDGSLEGAKDCKDCHYRDPQFRMPWKDGFMQHHQQAEDLEHSPHRSMRCTECHDPHKSVVYKLGGLTKECKDCHQEYRVRGSMGEIGVECVDCHMPFIGKSAVAVGPYEADIRGHLFRITTEPITRENNVANGFWNQDANGNSFTTLDYACKQCHSNMTMDQLAKASKAIHREPNLVDLTVNGFDSLRVVKTTEKLAVRFSIAAGDQKGKKAAWYVLCQNPRGWTYWDGRAWKSGNKPWRKGVAIADIEAQTVLNGKLTKKGYYTYWASIVANDGGHFADSVPVLVR